MTYQKTVAWKDCTLAQRPGRDGEPKVKTLIELPTFAILAPSNGSTHPSGRPYVRVSGDFTTIASYTAEERDALLALARSFDAMPRCEQVPTAKTSSSTLRPGEDFNARAFPGRVRPLPRPYYAVQAGRTYDVSPDGNRFLMIKSTAPTSNSSTLQLVVWQNWTEELKRLVPAK